MLMKRPNTLFHLAGNFMSYDETLKIRLQTGKRPKKRGFKATYRTSDRASTDEKVIILQTNTSGTLLYLNYPQQPPTSLDFLQRFIAPTGHVVSLTFHSVKLSQFPCQDENGMLEVFDRYSETNGTRWRLCYQSPFEEGIFFGSSTIHIKSFLNSIQLRQKSGLLGNPLNATLRVLVDEGYKTKLINYGNNEVEACSPNPCQNEGKCVNKLNRKICQCVGYFTGKSDL